MRAWLRQRRERAERIEDEAGELIRLVGDDAYAEARWREHTASSSATAQDPARSVAASDSSAEWQG